MCNIKIVLYLIFIFLLNVTELHGVSDSITCTSLASMLAPTKPEKNCTNICFGQCADYEHVHKVAESFIKNMLVVTGSKKKSSCIVKIKLATFAVFMTSLNLIKKKAYRQNLLKQEYCGTFARFVNVTQTQACSIYCANINKLTVGQCIYDQCICT